MPPVMAIVGRANVGKSTLVNRIAGRRAAIEHPEPGVTRDARGYDVTWAGSRFPFVDTAGMRKRAHEAQGPEYYGLVRSLRAIEEAHVVLHVIDASEGPSEQDQRIARRVAEAGRAAIVILNK